MPLFTMNFTRGPAQAGARHGAPVESWKRNLSLFLFSLLFVLNPLNASGKERIRNVEVKTVKQEIVVSADLTGGFSGKIINDIQNGIPKEFFYYLLLKRKEKAWFDEERLSKTLRVTVKYDTLKKDYLLIQSDGETLVERRIAEFEEMKKIVSRIDQVPLALLTEMRKGDRYYVSVKSQMKAAKLPFYLDYFLFFVPFLEIDTPWADSRPFTLEEGP